MRDRKRRKSLNIPGHAHELTFSCYRRHPFLLDSQCKIKFLRSLESARTTHEFLVWAYVIMPEHIHLLIAPKNDDYKISSILKSIKQPIARSEIEHAKRCRARLDPFIVTTCSGRTELRFWQAGGGYDRNLYSPKAIWAAIEYIHTNPVKRGLVEKPEEYEWSSYNAYIGNKEVPFEVDRCEVWEF